MARSQAERRFPLTDAQCARGRRHSGREIGPDGMIVDWYCGCDRPDPDADTMVLAWLISSRAADQARAARRLASRLRTEIWHPDNPDRQRMLTLLEHVARHRPARG